MSINSFTPEPDKQAGKLAQMVALQRERCQPADTIAGYAYLLLEEFEPGSAPYAQLRSVIDHCETLLTIARESTRIARSECLQQGQMSESAEQSRDKSNLYNWSADQNEAWQRASGALVTLIATLEHSPELGAVKDANRFLGAMKDAASRSATVICAPRAMHTDDAGQMHDIAGTLLNVNMQRRPSTTNHASGATVLVIDDDADTREILGLYLQRKGHRVLSARNGQDGLAMLRALAFDAILLDLDLPQLNGYQILETIKSDPVLGTIPVVIVSGFNERETVAHCLECGADDFIAKPFDPVLLLSRLRSSIEKKRLRNRENEGHEKLRREEERSRSLLLNILPAAVARRLDYGQTMIADHFADVSVLFCDLAGFTRYSSAVSPTELVKRLNLLFEAFDDLAVTHGVEKIKTVGDAYLAVAGLPEPCDDHGLRACKLGLDMIQTAAAMRQNGSLPLDVRVGVHSGPVTAGVIGKLKFAYDIWGDTVNVASRMESTGVTGAIQISESTRDKIFQTLHCEPRGSLMEVKGRGSMKTWLLHPPGCTALRTLSPP